MLLYMIEIDVIWKIEKDVFQLYVLDPSPPTDLIRVG